MNIHVILAMDSSVIRFGRLRRGSQYPDKYASLIGSEKDRAKIVSASSQHKHIEVETGVFKAEDGTEKQLKVSILPEMQLGRFNSPIVIKTDHEKIKSLVLNVNGEIVPNIILNPPFIRFGTLRRGGKYERSVRLTAAPGITFKVLDVRSDIPGLYARILTLREGKVYKIKAYIKEDFSGDSLNGKIIITTDDESQATIEVGVMGKVYDVKKLEPPTPGASMKK